MRKPTIIKVIIISLLINAVASIFKYTIKNDIKNNIWFWIIDQIQFFISFAIPLYVGIREEQIYKLKEKANLIIGQYLSLKYYKEFQLLYKELQEESDDFTKYSKQLKSEYLTIQSYKPIMELFFMEQNDEFYKNPEKLPPLISKIYESLSNIQQEIKDDHKKENKILQSNFKYTDRLEITEKIISIATFYHFYYPLDIMEQSIKDLIALHPLKDYEESFPINFNITYALNNFKFDIELYKYNIMTKDTFNNIKQFEQMENLVMLYLLPLIIDINTTNKLDKLDKIEIVLQIDAFFNLKKEIYQETILQLYYTLLISINTFIKNEFININLTIEEKNIIIEHLNMDDPTKEIFLNINSLLDFVINLFYFKYKTQLENHIKKYILIKNYDNKSHSILFDIYLNLNASKLILQKSIDNTKIKTAFLKMRHELYINFMVWYVDEICNLINNELFRPAQSLYDDLKIDDIIKDENYKDLTVKNTMLLCKAILQNRLYNNYQNSILIIKNIIENNNYIGRDAKQILYTLAIEKDDQNTIKYLINISSENEILQMEKNHQDLTTYGKIYTINTTEILYLTTPMSNGFIIKTTKPPSFIK